MAKYPHEITMENYGLSESDLSEEAQEALEDFNDYLDTLQAKKKEVIAKGETFTLGEAEKRKINRLSSVVCSEVEDMINDDGDGGDDEDDEDERSGGGFDLFAWMK